MRRELAISIMALAVASASFFVAITTPGHSATVRSYTPGGAPCAGVCSLAWAASEFGIPVGEPERLVVPAGSTITKMSYGRDGKPYWVNDSAVFAEDEPGIGYEVPGTPFWMVRIDECQNWALVVLGGPQLYALEPGPISPPSTVTLASYTPPDFPPSIFTPGNPTCCVSNPPDKPIIDTPSPVPLPASMWMLAVAIGGLALVKTRKA